MAVGFQMVWTILGAISMAVPSDTVVVGSSSGQASSTHAWYTSIDVRFIRRIDDVFRISIIDPVCHADPGMCLGRVEYPRPVP